MRRATSSGTLPGMSASSHRTKCATERGKRGKDCDVYRDLRLGTLRTAALLSSDGNQGAEFLVTFARHDLRSCDAVLVGQIKPGTVSGKQLEVLVIRPLLQHHVRCRHASIILRIDVGAAR